MLDIHQLETQTPKEINDLKTNLSFLGPSLKKIIKVLNHHAGKYAEQIDELNTLVALLDAFEKSFSMEKDLENQLQIIKEALERIHKLLIPIAMNEKGDLAQILQTFTQMLVVSIPTGRFLHQPIGLQETAWLIRYRLNQLQLISDRNAFQVALINLLEEIQKSFYNYQEGRVEIIDKIISDINTFMLSHEAEVKANSPWLLGLNQEFQIIQKRAQANSLRHRLDEINIELMGKRNTLNLQHARQLRQLQVKYKISDESKKKPVKRSLLSRIFGFFNLAKDIRKEKYLRAKVALNQKYNEDSRTLTQTHAEKYKTEIGKLEASFKKLKEEVQQLDSRFVGSVVMPLSFENHHTIRVLGNQHGGLFIGGLAQNKIISLGSSQGLCYGFTKEWLLHLNSLRALSLNESEIIDRVNLYAKKSEDDKSIFINQVNNLILNENVYKHFDEQSADKLKTEAKYRKTNPINESLPTLLFDTLINLKRPSLIMTITTPKEGAHALGFAKMKEGIWFHDSNYGCIYFPYHKSKADTEKALGDFLQSYLKLLYPTYNGASFIPISAKLGLKKAEQVAKSRTWTKAYKEKFKVGEKSAKIRKTLKLGLSRLKPKV